MVFEKMNIYYSLISLIIRVDYVQVSKLETKYAQGITYYKKDKVAKYARLNIGKITLSLRPKDSM